MNALQRQEPEGWFVKDSGVTKISKAFVERVKTPARSAVVREPVLIAAESVRIAANQVHTQELILEPQGWAKGNLMSLLTQGANPTALDLSAAEAALERMAMRSDEDPKEWAEKLGSTFGTFAD